VLQRGRSLREGQETTGLSVKKWKRIGCVAAVAAPLAFIGLGVYGILRGPTIGEHKTRAEAPISLPDGASDVSYYLRAPFDPATAYEFSISEEGFRKWAEEREWPLQEIGDEPVTITRYGAYAHTANAQREASVADGLYYEHYYEPDAGLHAVYDRRQGRAYYYVHTR